MISPDKVAAAMRKEQSDDPSFEFYARALPRIVNSLKLETERITHKGALTVARELAEYMLANPRKGRNLTDIALRSCITSINAALKRPCRLSDEQALMGRYSAPFNKDATALLEKGRLTYGRAIEISPAGFFTIMLNC